MRENNFYTRVAVALQDVLNTNLNDAVKYVKDYFPFVDSASSTAKILAVDSDNLQDAIEALKLANEDGSFSEIIDEYNEKTYAPKM